MMFGGFMWLFWIGLIVGIFFLVKSIAQQNRPETQKAGPSSLEILKKRYASGEIERNEYEQKRKDLLP